jgi:hypothetical protein
MRLQPPRLPTPNAHTFLLPSPHPTPPFGCPPSQVTKYVLNEILNHRRLVHPHIVQFKELFLTPAHLGIAMEYAAGGDMFEYVVRKGGLREGEARWFFQQLIVAVDYIHRMVRRGEGRGEGKGPEERGEEGRGEERVAAGMGAGRRGRGRRDRA